uniref:protein FAM166B-like n=1 Tax=Styela clava TaxID=7725 RepID=UPI00193929D4|nr:protein FAM166B-like [Styela clava]
MRQERLKLYTEPYYPPGYCGYSPQFPFQFGDTYGKTTSRLLTDPKVAKSGNMVLADIVPSNVSEINKQVPPNDWMRQRKQSWGDHKLTDKMVPGYTGYIPSGEDHFGSRYAKICKAAITDFDKEQQLYHDRRKELMKRKPPLIQQQKPAPYVSINPVQHSISPYFMSEYDPDKTFMSGYTGFIPRSRSRFATGYPVLTMESLREFTGHQQFLQTVAKQSVNMERNNLPRIKSSIDKSSIRRPIYVDSGLLPHYTGYLPGHKFRFGDTYGTSSRYFHQSTCSRVL